jgi:hypothetical protein
MPKFWVPQYTDYTDYKEAIETDESPRAAVFMLADSQLLFWKEEGFPWIWVCLMIRSQTINFIFQANKM